MQNLPLGFLNSSKNNTSKSRLQQGLPKIGKTAIYEQTDNNTSIIAQRFHWLVQQKDYSLVVDTDIDKEYQLLRRQLLVLNSEAARNVERLSLKSSRKAKLIPQTEKVLQVSVKELEINIAIIARLKYEYEQLQKRIMTITEVGKDEIDQSIADVKEKIISLRLKNKQLKQKSKKIGDSIQNGDEVFGEVKKLDVQLDLAERRRNKLQKQWDINCSNLQKIKKNIIQIDGGAAEAEQFIEQQLQTSKNDEFGRQIEFSYQHRTYELTTLQKNMTSLSNVKQQRYHQLLKQLDDFNMRLSGHEDRIHNFQERQMSQQKEITELEGKLKMAINRKKTENMGEAVFYTEVQQEEKQNQKDERKLKTDKRYKIEADGRKSDNIPAMTRQVKQIRQNKTQQLRTSQKSKEAVQINTIDQMQLQQDRKITEKQPLKFQKKSMQTQIYELNQPKSSQKIIGSFEPIDHNRQSLNIPHKKNLMKKLSQITILTKSKQEKVTKKLTIQPSLAQKDEIVEEITQKIQKSDNNKQIQSKQQNIMEEIEPAKIEIQPSIQKYPYKNQQKQVIKLQQTQTKLNQQMSQSDDDLYDFKKSINAEKFNFSLNRDKIDIALEQIETTIRRSEEANRLRKYSPKSKSIMEEEELFL